MHLLIPFAAPLSEAGREAARTLQCPTLQALLSQWAETARDEADEWCWSPPHERALARALGLQGGAGLLPWAALSAQQDGIATGDLAWGLLTPAHWLLGTDQVSLLDPAHLMLDDAGSRTLFDVVAPQFTSEGYAMHYAAPLRWYAAHESLAGLATASPDRVVGRNVDAWLGKDPLARRMRRLQSEVQMLLYTHPLNDERQAQGLLPVNSFWLSGCGVAQLATGAAPVVEDRLRAPALSDDWAAWCQAWDTLEAGPLARLLEAGRSGQAASLTLCGERAWVRLEPAPRSLLQRLRARFAPTDVHTLMETL